MVPSRIVLPALLLTASFAAGCGGGDARDEPGGPAGEGLDGAQPGLEAGASGTPVEAAPGTPGGPSEGLPSGQPGGQPPDALPVDDEMKQREALLKEGADLYRSAGGVAATAPASPPTGGPPASPPTGAQPPATPK